MFTLEQIKAAHSKVKSGADFPRYIDDLKKLGVSGYETFVSDGHSMFFGDNCQLASEPKYDKQEISGSSDRGLFTRELKLHQQGGSNYFEFCKVAAQAGIEKWVVNMKDMTCSYLDRKEQIVLVESIPTV
jgi:uncharacterized protein YbcV (DUF1398 family)